MASQTSRLPTEHHGQPFRPPSRQGFGEPQHCWEDLPQLAA